MGLYCLPVLQKYDARHIWDNLSCIVRKPAFCICENKDADQLRGNREADQHLCFRYVDNLQFLYKSEISSLKPSSVAVQPGFLSIQLIIMSIVVRKYVWNF